MNPLRSRLIAAGTFGPLLILASACNLAALDILIKLIGPSFSVWHIAFYRFFFGLLILAAVFGRAKDFFTSFSPKLMIVTSIVNALGFVALAASIRMINLSTAMVLFFSFPAFAALFSVVLFRERITKKNMFHILLALVGIMILFEFTLAGSFLGKALGLCSGIIIGLTLVLIQKLRERDGAAIIYFYYCLAGCIMACPFFIAEPRVPHCSTELLIVAGIVLTSVVATLLLNTGLRYCKSWESGIILTNELVFTALFGIFFFGDPVTWRFFLGGAMILGSAIALNISNNRKVPLTGVDR
jgi:drug/metabolite transporter (DMT)-like permease